MLTNRMLFRPFALATMLVAMTLPSEGNAQVRPCASPSALAEEQVAAFKAAVTSSRPSSLNFAQTHGVAGLTAADFVLETSDAVCTAVTNAIVSASGTSATPTANLLVYRAGSRFLALHASGEHTAFWTVSTTYDNVRASP